VNYMYAIKTLNNKITKDSRTGQLEIYETKEDAEKALSQYELATVDLDCVVEIGYFKTKGGES
jgi:hypothetical protein